MRRWRVLGRWRVQDLQEYQVFFFKSARFRFRSWQNSIIFRSWRDSIIFRSWQDSIIFKSWLDSIIFRSWRPTQLYFSCSHPKFCHQDGKCFETVQLWVKQKKTRPAPRFIFVIFNLIFKKKRTNNVKNEKPTELTRDDLPPNNCSLPNTESWQVWGGKQHLPQVLQGDVCRSWTGWAQHFPERNFIFWRLFNIFMNDILYFGGCAMFAGLWGGLWPCVAVPKR